ncbi:MAG: FkbM family methyltransferase [Bryobacteraceae bacterium]
MAPLRSIDRLRTLAQYLEVVGWRATLPLAGLRLRRTLGLPARRTVQLRPAQARYLLTMRTGNSSDGAVFWEIFLKGTYERLADLPAPKLILDLGANVGYSSVYFLNRFPNARVVAVEPDPESAAICRRNLAPYGTRARVVLGAAWPERALLVLSRGAYGDGREWATQVRERTAGDDGDGVEGWDVASLIDMAGADRADLLKVDIERSELALFGRNAHTWLARVDNICIELHGSECREVFFRALAGYDYELDSSPQLTICRNLRLKARSSRVN